jgi:hypothetical protein
MTILIEAFISFVQSLLANTGIVPQIRLRAHPSQVDIDCHLSSQCYVVKS